MPQEWWILRNNEMSDRSYTRNELLHLEEFGPETEVCRTNSNSWVEARRDPALASFFDDSDETTASARPQTDASEQGTIDFVPRYYRLLAGFVDLAALTVIVLLFNVVTYGIDFSQRTLFSLGFLIGGLTFPLFESGLVDYKTPGKHLFGLRVVREKEVSFPLVFAFGRFCLAFGPILLLGVAFDPSLPHDSVTQYVSLFFGSVGFSALSANAYLFFFNNPTYRLIQDYVFNSWVLPRTASMVPEAGFLRLQQLLPLCLFLILGVGFAVGGWGYFWSNKTPPLVSVPEACDQGRNHELIAESVNRNRYRGLLMNRRFSELEAELRDLFESYKAGESNDLHLDLATSVFAVMDRQVGRRINQWVIRDPGSPYALLARAKFHLREAKVLDKLLQSPQDETSFQSALEQARISARKAMNLNGELPSTYAVLVELNQIDGRRDKNQAILSRAMKLNPPSVTVARETLLTDQFTVRGSRSELHEQLRQLNTAIARSPSLGVFCGLPAQQIADRYQKQKQYRTARKYYDQALHYGETPWTRLRRALNALRSGASRVAHRDFTRSVKNLPNQTDAILQRARIHFERNDYSEALDALDLALQQEPHHPRTLYLHARVLSEIGESDRALDQLRTANNLISNWKPLESLRKKIALGD